jgi:hypothetical protein
MTARAASGATNVPRAPPSARPALHTEKEPRS